MFLEYYTAGWFQPTVLFKWYSEKNAKIKIRGHPGHQEMSSLSVFLLINGCSETGSAHRLSSFLSAKMLPVTVRNKHNEKQLFSINQLYNVSDKLFFLTKTDILMAF